MLASRLTAVATRCGAKGLTARWRQKPAGLALVESPFRMETLWSLLERAWVVLQYLFLLLKVRNGWIWCRKKCAFRKRLQVSTCSLVREKMTVKIRTGWSRSSERKLSDSQSNLCRLVGIWSIELGFIFFILFEQGYSAFLPIVYFK